jgi:CHAT domain-containing protein
MLCIVFLLLKSCSKIGVRVLETHSIKRSFLVDLAVISACKSALGEIDDQGVDGLMRAFKTAGVNSLVMATDDVVDYV